MKEWVCPHCENGGARHTVTVGETIFWLCPDCWLLLVSAVFNWTVMDIGELHRRVRQETGQKEADNATTE